MTSSNSKAELRLSSSQSVLHVITCLDVGGAELALKRLILSDSLAASRHVVVSLCDVGSVGRDLQEAGVTVHALHMGQVLSNASVMFRLVRLIARLKPAVIQTWMYHADLLGGLAARLAGRREVIWGIRQTGFASGASTVTVGVMKLCARVSSWVPRVIVCCAEAARDSHVGCGYDDKLMRVIPNGFELPNLSNVPEWRMKLRDQLKVPRDSLVIGMVARFDPVKDHYGFIQAAKVVAQANNDVRFILVGRGIDRANSTLLRWIRDVGLEDKFVLLGERRDIDVCLAAMDVFCLSSIHEGFPNAVGEAMAMALPCVVTDAGDAARIVGNTGWVVPTRDPKRLGNVLVEVISLPTANRQTVGLTARQRIQNEFSMANTRKLFEQAYIDACAGRSA